MLILFPTPVQSKPDGCTDIFTATNMDTLPVSFDDMFANGKTKTTAGDVQGPAFFSAEESLKNSWEVFFTYTDTIIANLHQDMAAISIVHAGHYTATRFPVFDRVLDKVGQYLRQTARGRGRGAA